MNPLKVAAAVAACALLFRLGFQMTRTVIDCGITAGRAETCRRPEDL
ncbi:hypothetical protein [uncultured Methylobacterium sp.]